MSAPGSLGSVGYCGFVCAICVHSDEGCLGCRTGGGNGHCAQRQCCKDRRLEGCWQCASFPCDKEYLASDEWRGLCIACVQAIQAHGVDAFVSRATSRLGDMVHYDDFRFKSAQEIAEMLWG